MPVGFVDPSEARKSALSVGKYTAKTYLWMFLGLAVTFIISMITISSPSMLKLVYGTRAACWIILLVEIIIVIALTASINKISAGAARVLFLVYSAINGITFSSVFLTYNVAECVYIFAVSAVIFGIMGVFGYVTKQDLSSWRKVLMFGLFDLILVALLSFFLNLSGMSLLINLAGVAVFLGFAAYDTQKIKAFYYGFQYDPVMLKKASVISALQLYLDFINLFLYVLRLFGGNGGSRN